MRVKSSSALMVFAAGALWGLMGLYVRRLTAGGLGSMQISALRCALTAAAIALYALVFDRAAFKIRLRDLWCFLGSGLMSIVFFNYCYFTAINLTSLSTAAVLLYTAPVMVMLMSCPLFRERLTARKLIAAAAAVAGCALVSGIGSGGALTPKALLIGLGAGLGYALYSIFSRFALNRGYKPLTITLYTFAVAAAGLIPFSRPTEIVAALTAEPVLIAWAAGLALFATIAPYALYTLGLSGLENGTASVIASVEPVVATLAGIILYKELPTVTAAAGVALVIGAIALLSVSGRKKQPTGA